MDDNHQSDLADEGYLYDDTKFAKTVEIAAQMLSELEMQIPEEDIEAATVSINAGKLADICSALLAIVDVYEGDVADVEELLEFAEIQLSTQTAKTVDTVQ